MSKKSTHLNPQDPFLFNIFYLQFKRDRDTDHRVVDESQQEDLQSTHIFPRLRCLLLSCTKTIWWYTMASFLLKVFQAPLFLLKRSDFNGYHIACDWNWTGHVLLSFGRVYPQYISELWVYRLLCPLKLIHCLSHKCFFHLPWHLTGPSFNSVTFHHPAGSTWSSYLSRPAWVQLESHLNANRLPSIEAVNQPDIRRRSAIQAT